METVEVMLRIPKNLYEDLTRDQQEWALCAKVECYNLTIGKAFKNGTVLPKGHDRLIEGDKLIEKIKPLISNKAIIETIDTIITFSPTVIEADKDGE